MAGRELASAHAYHLGAGDANDSGRAYDAPMAARQTDSTVLVTGAGGFIGGHLVAALLGAGRAVRAVDRRPIEEWRQLDPDADNRVADLSLPDHCRDAADGVTAVYNLASDMGGMGFIEANKARCMLSVLINTQMLLASRDAGVDRFFFSSSACVYPQGKQESPDVEPLKESDAYPALPEDGYGWEKLFGERMCRHFREDFGLEARVARLHNVYGPHAAWRGGREKAPAAICRKVAEAKLGGSGRIEIWGDGRQTRSFTYIDDCVEGILRIAAGDVAEPLNLGSSELVSVDQLVSLVEQAAGVELERVYDTSAPQGVRGRNSDNTLIRENFDWEPSISLRDGLERTYAWVHEQVAAALAAGQAPAP
jgi:nucleoside-diphosphate-sugar epimerase